MARKKIMFGVAAGMISLAIDGLAGLIILGLLVRYLPPKAASYWLLITTTGSFLLLLQCGLGPTVAREVGQTRIPENQPRLPQLFGTIRQAFVFVAALVAVVAVALYFFYLRGVARSNGLGSQTAAAWFLYAAGVAMNLQGQGRLFIMDGFGEVGWEKVFRIFFTTFGLAAIWIALRAGASVMQLGAIYAVQNALFWLAAARKTHVALPVTRVTAPPLPGQLIRLLHEGGKILFLNVTAFAVTYTGVYVVQSRFGLAAVTPFTAMLKVGVLLVSVSMLLPQMLYPYVATAWAGNDRDRCRRYYLVGVSGAVGIFIVLAVPLFLLRDTLFTHWLGKGQYLGAATLGAFLVYQLLYVNHAAQGTPVLASMGNAFIAPSILAALLMPSLEVLLPRWLGVVGIPIGMILGILPPTCMVVWRSWHYMMSPRDQTNREIPTVPEPSAG
jgi:O-antigen/teichoic acid export membrane protein